MAKKTLPEGYVEVVLLRDRDGLGRKGASVAVSENRAERWCQKGICRLPGNAAPIASAKAEESPAPRAAALKSTDL